MQEGRNTAEGESGETKSHHDDEHEVRNTAFKLPLFFSVLVPFFLFSSRSFVLLFKL